MTVRTMEGSTLEPIPFALLPGACAVPLRDLDTRTTTALSEPEDRSLEEIPTATGCLRGFCWAICIECAAAACAYGFWHFWLYVQ
jgi:hypothetical protein